MRARAGHTGSSIAGDRSGKVGRWEANSRLGSYTRCTASKYTNCGGYSVSGTQAQFLIQYPCIRAAIVLGGRVASIVLDTPKDFISPGHLSSRVIITHKRSWAVDGEEVISGIREYEKR